MGCGMQNFFSFSREFNTSADIQLHKWADSYELAKLCAKVGSVLCERMHVFCVYRQVRIVLIR